MQTGFQPGLSVTDARKEGERAFHPSAPPPYAPSSVMAASSTRAVPSLDDLLADTPPEIQQHVREGHEQLSKFGMEKHRARVCVTLDISKSMQNPNKLFKNDRGENQVQALINRAFALAILLDDDGEVEVIPFGDRAYPPIKINRSNYQQATQLVLSATNGLKDYTDYPAAIRAVREHYFEDTVERSAALESKALPVFNLFITDGAPNVENLDEKESEAAARKECKSASYNAMFVKYLAIKTGLAKKLDEFAFLKSIDDAKDFFVDNSDFVEVERKLTRDGAGDFFVVGSDGVERKLAMEDLLNEYRGWLIEAYEARLISHPNIDLNVKYAEGRKAGLASQKGLFAVGSSPFAKARQEICKELDAYLSRWWRHHAGRATDVKKAINACKTFDDIALVLNNQKAVLENPGRVLRSEAPSEKLLSPRWSNAKALVNRVKKEDLQKSAYFVAIENALATLEKHHPAAEAKRTYCNHS